LHENCKVSIGKAAQRNDTSGLKGAFTSYEKLQSCEKHVKRGKAPRKGWGGQRKKIHACRGKKSRRGSGFSTMTPSRRIPPKRRTKNDCKKNSGGEKGTTSLADAIGGKLLIISTREQSAFLQKRRLLEESFGRKGKEGGSVAGPDWMQSKRKKRFLNNLPRTK